MKIKRATKYPNKNVHPTINYKNNANFYFVF